MIQIPALIPKDKHNQDLLDNLHPPDWVNPQPASRYNLVVIGGGSAGLVAAVGAAGLGARVALIERRFLGGDCLNVGCIPSKTVIRSSKIFGDLYQAKELGINVPPGSEADFAAVMARMRQVRAELSRDDSIWQFQKMGIDVFLGDGRFTGPNSVEVAGATLNFKKAVISTGSRAMHLPIDGLAEAGYLTNETLFSLTERPGRLAVIGAGPIGSELAQALRRLGCKVTVFDILPQILGREDEDAAGIVEAIMVNEGVDFMLEAQIQRVKVSDTEKVIEYEHQGRQKTLAVDEILSAVGRVPNVEGLNLEAANVEYHRKGVAVNDYLQTTNPNIYAAGDVAMMYQFTHAADASARIVLQNALFMGRKKLSGLTIPWCTYTDPEVAHVGMYPRDAQAAGIALDTFVVPMAEVHRAVADGEKDGFVKVHVRSGTDQILGATIVARHAGEMINEITLAMVGNLGLKTLSTVIHPYPTQAEAIKKVADAYNRTRLTPPVKKVMSGWLGLAANQRLEQPETRFALGALTLGLVSTFALFGIRVARSRTRE